MASLAYSSDTLQPLLELLFEFFQGRGCLFPLPGFVFRLLVDFRKPPVQGGKVRPVLFRRVVELLVYPVLLLFQCGNLLLAFGDGLFVGALQLSEGLTEL